MSRIKFVRERVNGKKGMLIGLGLAAMIIVAGIFIMPTKGNGYVPPLVIHGIVINQNGDPVAGATVNLTDMTNGEWMTNTTNAAGYYSITFGGVGGTPWNESDWLVGIATDGINNGTNDTVMRNVSDIWFNFTIDTPVTTKHIVGSHHSHPLYGDYYFIKLNTVFNFTAVDPHDGINATYYRIWYNGQWHPSPGTGYGKGNNFSIYSGNFTMGDFPWAGEGQYLIEYYSVDDNSTIPGVEYTHKQWHDVDETLPEYSVDFGSDTVTTNYGGLDYTMIKGCAPIWIHAYDTGICQSGVKWLNITGSYIGEWPGQTVEPRFDIHIMDGGAGDEDGEVNGEILANVTFCEDSFHELDITITDYVGNEATYDIDLAVDYTPPSVTKTIVGPTYPGPHGNETWLACNSTIWLNATDSGCNGGAGVGAIGFTIWWKENESDPVWNTTKYPPVTVPDNGAYNSTIYDLDPANGSISVKIHFKEDCYHLLKAWAIDKVGNNNTLAVKNKYYVDCTPPAIRKDIEKITALEQTLDGENVSLRLGDNNQSFTAPWSYIDAVSVKLFGSGDSMHTTNDTWVEIWDDGGNLLASSEVKQIDGVINGWIQFHLPSRLYVEHGETYWLTVKSYADLHWYYNGSNPYAGGYAIVNGTANYSCDFAFKIEYYPIYPYFYPMEYTFFNETEQHDGLNGTWITSNTFFNLTAEDEGCMGGVGLASLQYRIWQSVIKNGNFENVSLYGWNSYIPSGASISINSSHVGDLGTIYYPVAGNHFVVLKTDGPGDYTTLSQEIYMFAGETISGWAAFDDRDYVPFNDSAYVRILDSLGNVIDTPWYVNTSIVGDYADTPWTYWSWTAPASGTYTLELGVANDRDSLVDSYALFDNINLWRVKQDWTPYTQSFNLSWQCAHKIEMKAVDLLGNTRIINQTHYVDNSPPTDVVNIPDRHGYYYYDGKQYIRAGYGIWINLTDEPECGVGLRNAKLYWRYTYTNFTTPSIEEHPINGSDYYMSYDIEYKNGKYWYVVPMNQSSSSAYISFDKECFHTIYYFYNATDWLDNEVVSGVKSISLYVDEHEPIAWADYPWHYYQEIDNESGHIRAGANFTLYAKDMPNPIPMMCIAQMEGGQRDSLQSYPQMWPWDAQSFVAECHHINVTKLYLNWTGPANVTVYIHDENMTVLGSSTVALNGSGEGWVEFVYNPGLDTQIGKTYYIEVHAQGNKSVDWFYSQNNPYDNGYAVISGAPHGDPVNGSFDWRFQIISDEENPCASGAEGIYYGYYYNGTWYPDGPGDGVLNISRYYNDTEINNNFMGHHYWYVVNDSSPLDRDARHGYIEANITFNEECIHDFYYWTKDNVCHHSELYHHVFYVDDSAPELNVEMPSCYTPIYAMAEKLDLVFVVDTSGSMDNEWNTLDSIMQGIVDNITAQGIDINVTIYGLAWNRSTLPYGRGMYTVWFNGTNVSAWDEDWGPGTAWAALWHPWRPGAARVIIPISDECAYHGDYETIEDLQSIQEAISACQNNSVVVYPFYGDGSSSNVTSEMWQLANGTGGRVFYFGNASNVTENLLNVLSNVYVLVRESISCNATIHLSAIDYPVTNGKRVDQEQTIGNVYDAIENETTPLYTAQSFIPTVDELDAVQLLLDSGSGGWINVSIYDSGLNLLGYSNMSVGAINQTWIQFHFSNISLIPGETYWISVQAYPNGSVSWMWYNMSDAYSNGVMVRTGGIDISHDFAFKTEYYGDVEGECSSGLEGIYYGYEYNGVWHPASIDDNVTEHGMVFNISNYYSQEEINDSFGGHTLWYVYNDSIGITFFKECKHDLYYWAKDNVCHHSVVYHRTLYVDNSEPYINKTHPSHGYEVVNGTPYVRAGANITLYAEDMPTNNCSSGTWLFWRYVWNNNEYYPFFYHEGFEGGLPGSPSWWSLDTVNHTGNYSAMAYSSSQGWDWLKTDAIYLPDIPKITLTFWQRADNLSNYDASNIFGIENETGVFTPLKFFYRDDMGDEWQKVTIDLTPYANKTIYLVWIYENDYGDGEVWYIDDVNITGWYGTYGYENVSVNISFSQECHHDLYYFAEDTTCHKTPIYHQEYYVDGTAPETTLQVITNGYRPSPYYPELDYTICINDSINITTNNSGSMPCIYPYTHTYYRWIWIDENGTKHYYPDSSDPQAINGSILEASNYADEIAPYFWLPYNGTFKFPEGCVHWLYFFSKDELSNTEKPHNVTFGVDDEAPVTTMELQGIEYSPDPNIVYIRNNTIIWLNATDMPNYPNCTTGINYTLYAIWKYNYSRPGWDLLVPWRSTNDPIPQGVTVHWYGNGTSARRISIEINIAELIHPYVENGKYDTDCGKYEIHWRSVDYNGLVEMENDKDVIVDCTPPDSTKEFGYPVVPFYLQAELMHWISSATPIYINATDDEVWDSGAAKVCIMYKKVDEIEYTEMCQNGSNGIFHITGEDGKYRVFHWAVDHVGHAQDYNLTKQHVYLDNSPPESRIADIIPWNRTDVPFDITVTNITDHGPEVMGKDGVGVCKIEVYYRYSFDNTTWGPWVLYAVNTTPITNPDGSVMDWTLSFTAPEASGYYQFKSIAYDCLDNVEQPPFYYGDYDAWCYVLVDSEPPVVTKEYGQPSVEADLGGGEMGHVITSDTPIYINATDMPEDNYTGIDKIYWSFDGITWYETVSYGGAHEAHYFFTPAALGLDEGTIYNIFFKASDMLGHVSDEGKQKFVIDDTPPESTANVTCDGNTIFVTANATDEFAGVENVELFMRYSADGINWTGWTSCGYGMYNSSENKWEWILEDMNTGYYEFYTIATDYVGNVEDIPSQPDASCRIKEYPPWDVNMDGNVNVLDMIIVSQHWMETPSSPNWYSRADVNGDGMVNILDLILVGQHMGETYP